MGEPGGPLASLVHVVSLDGQLYSTVRWGTKGESHSCFSESPLTSKDMNNEMVLVPDHPHVLIG